MNKKISLDMLKIILTPKEMKNVLGGSTGCCCVGGACAPEYMCTNNSGCSSWHGATCRPDCSM